MINLTQITNISWQNLVSLCSDISIDKSIIYGFIFTCFVASVLLTLINFSSNAGNKRLKNGKWVLQAILTGAVGGAKNAGIQITFPVPPSGGGGGNNGSGSNNPGNNAPRDNNPGNNNPGDNTPSNNNPGNTNPGDTGNKKPGNTGGNTGGTNNTGGNTSGNSTTGSSSS